MQGDRQRLLVEGVGVDGDLVIADRLDSERDTFVPILARDIGEGVLLVATEAEVEREGVAELKEPRVRPQVPGLDGRRPSRVVAYAVGQELLQHMLFADELSGFFEFVAFGSGPIAWAAKERVQERRIALGTNTRRVQRIGVQADQQGDVGVLFAKTGDAAPPSLEAVRLAQRS